MLSFMVRSTQSAIYKRRRLVRDFFWPVSAAVLLASVAQAEVRRGVDAEAGLPYWEVQEPGISLRLVQRLPDQTRAFFLARGFARADADAIAQSCVFQTVLKNTSQLSTPSTLEITLRDWQVHRAASRSGLKTREDWATDWVARKISQSARIAFEWALFPTRQIYNPGDYNWGMTVFNIPPDTRFDLEVVWQQDAKRHSVMLGDVHCASDALGAEQSP